MMMDKIEAKVDASQWPEGVRQLSVNDTDYFGIDQKRRLYWNGRLVGTQQALTRRHKLFIGAVAAAVVVGGIGEAVRGAIAYDNWACHMRPNWPSVCPNPGMPKL